MSDSRPEMSTTAHALIARPGQAEDMKNEPRHTDDDQAYPHQPQEGRPEPRGRMRPVTIAALTLAGILTAGALVVGAGVGILYAVNPVADEWICSEGEAPAGNGCYAEGSTLPAGVTWDPFGNRPMAYNCHKDGWIQIERSVTRRGARDVEQDCVREGTELPGRWHTVQAD